MFQYPMYTDLGVDVKTPPTNAAIHVCQLYQVDLSR